MYQQLLTKLNQLAVGLYKSFGSTMLGLILLGLLSYLGGQVFFLVSSRWTAPTVVSPTDRRIVELSAQLAEQSVARDRLVAERRSVEARIADADRRIAAALEFQHRYRQTLSTEQRTRRRERGRLTAILREYERARTEVLASNQAYGKLARDRAGVLRDAQLIDQEDFLTRNHAAAQLAQSSLALVEQQATLHSRQDGLRWQLAGLRALVRGESPRSLPPDLLMLAQSSVESELELARQERTKSDLRAEVADLDADLARLEQLLATLRASPYLEAIHSPLTVAFVPYANLAHAQPGAPVYGCALLFLWCHPVGTVAGIIPGEVQEEHPVRHLTLRGNMVTLSLSDPAAAHDRILHLGRAPLGF